MKKETLLNSSMLILRLILGGILLVHGAQKLFGMFGGVGMDGTTKIVESLGFGFPNIMAVVWASIEFFGGLFLVLGILVRAAALMLVLVLLVGFWKVSMVYGTFTYGVEFEYYVLMLGVCVPLILVGGGSWSVWDV